MNGNTETTTDERGGEQRRLWNGVSGCAWVDAQETLDQMYNPFEEMLVEAVSLRASPKGLDVLDVGCGTGGTTVAVARWLGTRGRATGIDISDPMIAAARARAEREHVAAHFICANAQEHAFEPASADMIISRFGVMFFDDPVRAFANLRRAATDEAELRVIVWRSMGENPFMTTAERAAAPLLPNLPPRRPDAPGQFAFADAARVSTILEQSGWGGIDIQPIDVACTFPEQEMVPYLTRFGPVGMVLKDADDQTRPRVIETARAAFDPFVHGAEVRFTAACWMVGARSAALP
jgi:SAM-dependent methyltransferase